MLDRNMIEMTREHCQDMLAAAEQERLARLARAGQDQHRGITCRVLRWLGRELVALGLQLQERQGVTTAPSLPLPGSTR